MENELKHRWDQLLTVSHIDQAVGQSLFEALKLKYQHASRHYHNLSHIYSMLTLSDQYPYRIELQWAIWFHDAVYAISRSDNEEKSADYAAKELTRLGLSKRTVEEITRLIQLTKDHETDHTDTLGKQLLDLDLSVLGAHPNEYMNYSHQVRKEYGIFPDILYLPGRTKVLHAFLAGPSIFQTPEFEGLETQARENIQSELKSYQR